MADLLHPPDGGLQRCVGAMAATDSEAIQPSVVRCCPDYYWRGLHARFGGSGGAGPPLHPLGRDLTHLWSQSLALLDYQTVAAFGLSCRETSRLCRDAGTVARLKAQLGAPHLFGTAADMLRLAAALDRLRCSISPGWAADARSVDLAVLRRVRRRFPEARLYLWRPAFPPGTAEKLAEPLAFVEAAPAAVVTIGTVTLRLTLRLLCVSDQFFDPAHPLRRLLARLELEVDSGPVVWPGGAPGPDGHLLCGEGHRWSCICEGAEVGSSTPLFCSLRETYLRPSWRHPHVMARCERRLQQRCEALDGELLQHQLEVPLGLCLAVYRTDDDEGPDEPER